MGIAFYLKDTGCPGWPGLGSTEVLTECVKTPLGNSLADWLWGGGADPGLRGSR